MSKTSVTAMLTAGLVCSVAGQTGSWSLSSGWGVDTSVAGIEAIHMIHLPVLPAVAAVKWSLQTRSSETFAPSKGWPGEVVDLFVGERPRTSRHENTDRPEGPQIAVAQGIALGRKHAPTRRALKGHEYLNIAGGVYRTFGNLAPLPHGTTETILYPRHRGPSSTDCSRFSSAASLFKFRSSWPRERRSQTLA